MTEVHSSFRIVIFWRVHPISDLADISLVGNWENLPCDEIVKEIQHFGNYENYELGKYPQNVLRNVARSGVNTEFIYLIDIDTIPSSQLREKFRNFLSDKNLWGNSENVVYVTPTFEIKGSF